MILLRHIFYTRHTKLLMSVMLWRFWLWNTRYRGSRLMRISLLRFFKKIHKLPYANLCLKYALGHLISLHCKPIPCNENRVLPVKFSHREIPVVKTGVPTMRTGVPCIENRIFPVWKTSQGKPCSGPVLALYRIAVHVQRNH